MSVTYSYGPGSYDVNYCDSQIRASGLPGYEYLNGYGYPYPPQPGDKATNVDTFWSATLSTGDKSTLDSIMGATAPTSPGPAVAKSWPGGRLTLTSGVPVQTTDVVNAPTIYYTPYSSDQVPLYNGTSWVQTAFTERSLVLDSNTGHTGYHIAQANFDLYLFDNAGVLRLGSVQWYNSSTIPNVRWSGSVGAPEPVRLGGLFVNSAAFSVRWGTNIADTATLAINRGLYLGTFRVPTGTDGVACWSAAPAAAVGGGNARLYLWNMYNRVNVFAKSIENQGSWSYTGGWRSWFGSANNRCSFIIGQQEDAFDGRASMYRVDPVPGNDGAVSIGYDSTTAPAGEYVNAFAGGSTTLGVPINCHHRVQPAVGLHYFQGLELASSSAPTFRSQGASIVSLLGRM